MKIEKTVLIIDPVSSGRLFAKRIRELYGFNVISLITTLDIPDSVKASFQQDDYDHVFHFESLEKTIFEIEEYIGNFPDHIICGSELGVPIFDLLSNHWNLLPNALELSKSRKDKYLMQNRLKESNIRYIPFFKSNDLNEILGWCKNNPFNSYVIKPINSFATDGVSFCNTFLDIESAFNKLINTVDYAGEINKEVLIEKKIDGVEYVVDAVTSLGKHFIVNIFKYVKKEINGCPIYKKMVTESLEDHPELVSYVEKVLTSLGIKNGTSHSEVIISDTGPVLVETGARMHGGQGPLLVEKCNSHSLIDLSIFCRISPSDFQNKTKETPHLTKHAVEYFLSSPKSGIIKEINIENITSSLDSYSFSSCGYSVGDFIDKTVDLMTSYGRIVLVSSDVNQLENDSQRLTALESECLLISVE